MLRYSGRNTLTENLENVILFHSNITSHKTV